MVMVLDGPRSVPVLVTTTDTLGLRRTAAMRWRWAPPVSQTRPLRQM